jgi:hypothetical protein
MKPPVTAALTPEQWASLRRDRGVRMRDDSGGVGIAYAHTLDENGRGVTLERQSSSGWGSRVLLGPSSLRNFGSWVVS